MTVGRRIGVLVLALATGVGFLAAPPTVPDVRAATPDLTIVASARYDVQPDRARIVVTVDLDLTNTLRDTATRRYYFDRARIAVMPGTSAHRLTWSGSGSPGVSVVTRARDYTVLELNLAQRLYGRQSARYRLRFVIADPGGAATRDIRVGDSLVAFPVWAFATESTPGSSATVVFPAGFTVEVAAGEIPAPTVDATGRTIFRTGLLAEPLSFFAYLVADRPGAYTDHALEARVGDAAIDLTVRAWPDDDVWAERVGGLVVRALPVLGERIGLPWPRDDGLVIQETVSRSTGGYAGLFDPTSGLVEVAYYADDFVVLHEAAHAWFNGALLADRWANEAFASYYALVAAETLDVSVEGHELTDELRAARIPLNAWGPLGRESGETEDYAYAATLELARLIADRAGEDGLAAVWVAASDRVGAYQPPVPGLDGEAEEPERVAGPPDWRGLLDLLDDLAGGTYEDLWRDWIARPEDEALLEERAAARAAYAATVARAGDWALPRPIRDSLRAWSFDQAVPLLEAAGEALALKDSVHAAAAAAGLSPPGTLRLAFENDDGFADVTIEAEAQLEAISRYDDAVAVRLISPDLLEELGLWQADPDARLAEARAAFAAGDLAGAAHASDAARSTWAEAAEIGRGRLIGIVAGTLALLLGLLILLALARRSVSRRRRVRASTAPPGPGVPPVE